MTRCVTHRVAGLRMVRMTWPHEPSEQLAPAPRVNSVAMARCSRPGPCLSSPATDDPAGPGSGHHGPFGIKIHGPNGPWCHGPEPGCYLRETRRAVRRPVRRATLRAP